MARCRAIVFLMTEPSCWRCSERIRQRARNRRGQALACLDRRRHHRRRDSGPDHATQPPLHSDRRLAPPREAKKPVPSAVCRDQLHPRASDALLLSARVPFQVLSQGTSRAKANSPFRCLVAGTLAATTSRSSGLSQRNSPPPSKSRHL